MAQQNTMPIKAVLISCIVVPLFTGFFKTVTPCLTVKVCSTLQKTDGCKTHMEEIDKETKA